MTVNIPCESSETPDDWFISRDGKQYPSDELVSEEDFKAAVAEAEKDGYVMIGPARERLRDRLEAEARREALARRRHAKEECHENCYFRTQCLDLALQEPTPALHGTWGGYYEEELDQIRRERNRRRRARKG